tara:strand:+ start:342 stop:830 length:489 start_codon:yes stop_codon:yes gene_type:complete
MYSFLLNEIGRKRTLLQLARAKNIPKDIIIIIYNISITKEQDDIQEEIRFKTDMLYNRLNYWRNGVYLPIGKGVEWVIKARQKFPKYSRYYLMIQINIIGVEGYLKERNENKVIKAGLPRIIKYLNTSPSDEVMEDYNNYIHWVGPSLLIDKCGDTSFYNNN